MKFYTLFMLTVASSLLGNSCASLLPPPTLEPIETRDVKLKGHFPTGGKVDTEARPRHEPNRILPTSETPRFPSRLKHAGIEGTAVMAVAIDANGDVTDVEALEATDRRFAESAKTVMRKWKFVPAKKDGKNVGSVRTFPIRFTLR